MSCSEGQSRVLSRLGLTGASNSDLIAATRFVLTEVLGCTAHLVNMSAHTFRSKCTELDCPAHQLAGGLARYSWIASVRVVYVDQVRMIGEYRYGMSGNKVV